MIAAGSLAGIARRLASIVTDGAAVRSLLGLASGAVVALWVTVGAWRRTEWAAHTMPAAQNTATAVDITA